MLHVPSRDEYSIFVTVGTQLPFDRLVRAVDAWAGKTGCDDVFAQIGPSQLSPEFLNFSQFLEPSEFQQRVASCRLLVAHAGMGSIITAMQLGRPILVMPRLASLGEHRNDHQLSTAKRLAKRGIYVASDERELTAILGQIDQLTAPNTLTAEAPLELVNAIQNFIDGRSK
jgi:UDP-N-acetylglucosamine transferase subunit ALG13